MEAHIGIMPHNYTAEALGMHRNAHAPDGPDLLDAAARAKVRKVCEPYVVATEQLLGIPLREKFGWEL